MGQQAISATAPQFRLEVTAGPQTGELIPLPAGDLVVGRGDRCAVRLTDPAVAPAHCGLRVRESQVICAPGGRVVPTLVNGEPLAAARLLRVGDRIRVGDTELLLRVQVDSREKRFWPGDTVGPFRLQAELGAGALGRVFEAIEVKSGRRVALKTMRLPADCTPREEQIRRGLMRREGHALAAVRHPHVMRCYGGGETDRIPWLALEFLDGISLREKLAGGRLSIRQTESIMFQLCSALAACHEARVLHCDLKPGNIMMVDQEQRVVLADFGLAQPLRAVDLEDKDPIHPDDVIRVGRQVGTPAYMPPEQTQGLPADTRSDVWSLGVILYELASGRRPFRAAQLRELLTAVARECPEPLPDDIDPALAGAVYRCLQKRPARRFASALDLLDVIGDRRLVQVLPVGVEGPPRRPFTHCPFCGAPAQSPLRCPACLKNVYHFGSGQVLTVTLPDGRVVYGCGACGNLVKRDDQRCALCGTEYLDTPAEGTRPVASLTRGAQVLVDAADQALELLEKCPICNTARTAGKLACGNCGLAYKAYTAGRVRLELALGGWAVRCGNCNALCEDPSEPYCPACGMNFANGQMPDGTFFIDEVPLELRRKLQRREQ